MSTERGGKKGGGCTVKDAIGTVLVAFVVFRLVDDGDDDGVVVHEAVLERWLRAQLSQGLVLSVMMVGRLMGLSRHFGDESVVVVACADKIFRFFFSSQPLFVIGVLYH